MIEIDHLYTKILSDLVKFKSVSHLSNIEIISYIESILRAAGFVCERVPSPDGEKTSLLASAGDVARPGVVLSAHTDVVPADGQAWSSPAFEPRVQDNRLYGRGATDMKGFIAVVLAHAHQLAGSAVAAPVHLAFSYDEELGCRGAPDLVARVKTLPALPALCIVGEPTGMRVANAHKGKHARRITLRGRTGHSATPDEGASALDVAVRLAARLHEIADELAAEPLDESFSPPCSTLHIGTLKSGGTLNLIPEHALLEYELRHLPGLDAGTTTLRVDRHVSAFDRALRSRAPEGGIAVEDLSSYPALEGNQDGNMSRIMKRLAGSDEPMTSLSFGTEAGLYAAAGIQTFVCGPGDMGRAHKADEWIGLDELASAGRMLDRLADMLRTGW